MSTESEPTSLIPADLHEVQQVLGALDAASQALLAQCHYPATGSADDIRLSVAATASGAGSVALRGAVPEIEKYTEGEFVLSDVHDAQGRLLSFMAAVAPLLGLAPVVGNVGSPSEDQVEIDVSELVGRVQGPLQRVTADAALEPKFSGYVAALAAMRLVELGHSSGVLDQDVGQAVAAYYLVAGSKTVPPHLHPDKHGA